MTRSKPKLPAAWAGRLLSANREDRLATVLRSALVSCLATDAFVARRTAIAGVLADGRPHAAPEIRKRVAALLGRKCWGRSPAQSLWADLRLLRRGGLRIGYSRRPRAQGYFLYDPPLVLSASNRPDRPSPEQWAAWRSWSTTRKLQSMFSAWEFALDLARAGARSRHPAWPPDQIEAEARRLMGGQQRR